MWQWANFLHAQVPAEVPRLNINMDETSIRLHPDTGIGYLCKGARRAKRTPKSLVRNLTQGQKRGAFTHVALLCDDIDVQPLLPQFLFVNVAS